MNNTSNRSRKKKKKNNNSLRLIFVFCFFVFFLIIGVTILKIFNLVSKSTFDGQQSFVVAFAFTGNSEIDYVHFAPDADSIRILKITKLKNADKQIHSLGKKLKIPIDATVVFPKALFSNGKPDSYLTAMILRKEKFSTELTDIDIIRLLLFTKRVPSLSIEIKTLDLSSGNLDRDNVLALDKISSSVFSDKEVIKEQISIQIVNKADMAGLGSRLARLVGNIGGDVIAVTTDREVSDNSEILYEGEKTYTLARLSKILKFPVKMIENNSGTRIGEIIIILGKDYISTSVF